MIVTHSTDFTQFYSRTYAGFYFGRCTREKNFPPGRGGLHQNLQQKSRNQEFRGWGYAHRDPTTPPLTAYVVVSPLVKFEYKRNALTAQVFSSSSISRSDPGFACLFHGLTPVSPGKFDGMISRSTSFVMTAVKVIENSCIRKKQDFLRKYK